MTEVEVVDEFPVEPRVLRPHINSVTLTNFLSYREAVLDLNGFVALVGPNASGKSNAVAAVKLLRDIPIMGLPAAIARRGGFDQLRHRSQGRPYDPALRVDFAFEDDPGSSGHYELRLKTIGEKKYAVKTETGSIVARGQEFAFANVNGVVTFHERWGDGDDERMSYESRVPPAQSALNAAASFAPYQVGQVLTGIQTVEINTTRVSDLQDTSSTEVFEPDGSNTSSIYEALGAGARERLIDDLRAIVPGMDRIEVRRFADKVTLAFFQSVGTRTRREFLAQQMSDGTLRAFAIVLALAQPTRPSLVVIEEPEIAIHLGALRTLVDLLEQESETTQILITTHSADIVDTLGVDALRVVWSEKGSSRIARVAEHTRNVVVSGLISPGDLLRSNALDPA